MNQLLLSFSLVLCTVLFPDQAYSASHLWSQSLPDYSQRYDEKRDPAQDLTAAASRAQQEGKKILLQVGGEWCSWCQEMNHFLDRETELASQLNSTFVVVKLTSSPTSR